MVDKRKTVKLSDKNRRIGDDHPRAKLTDQEVEDIRELYEEGLYGYTALALHFSNLLGKTITKTEIAKICRYERRNTYTANFKTVPIKE